MSGQYEIGMIGLGVMGRNLLLNIADHGFSAAGYDKDLSQVEALRTEAGERTIMAAQSPAELVAALRAPRAVIMLVPAGKVVDAVISDLQPLLDQGDLIIDCGNSYFKDTDRREKALAEAGIHFMGAGVSGGESGARHGPSIMPGGRPDAYERVRPILEAAAAHVDGDPCVAHMGPGAAGHYVKMVHNGIEYAIMQLISEAYDVMRRGLGMSVSGMQEVFAGWNRREAASFLLEITADIFAEIDEESGRPLLDMIRDEAHQLGTGMWTSQDAMDLGVPVPSMDVAVAMRNLSSFKKERLAAARVLGGSKSAGERAATADERRDMLDRLGDAFFAAMVIAYAQGMAQLRAASAAYGYSLDLEAVARIWRGGCIIRAALLEDIRQAYLKDPELANILLDDTIGGKVLKRLDALAAIAGEAARMQVPVPGMMTALAYCDAYRSSRLPANLVQAQRDYFGAHRYERIDREGSFHTQWARP